jgi:hypothetical protein
MALLKLDEAAAAYQVHRTTLYRALREGKLNRKGVDGSLATWLDSDEVERLVRPERLTEAELLELLRHVADVFYEEFDDALNADGRPASLEADLVRRLARFLDKFNLVPRPDFADTVTPGVMYESSEPRYRDRPLLAFSGTAEGRADGVFWSFWLSTHLAPDLNALVGESLGIASAARFTNPARD